MVHIELMSNAFVISIWLLCCYFTICSQGKTSEIEAMQEELNLLREYKVETEKKILAFQTEHKNFESKIESLQEK